MESVFFKFKKFIAPVLRKVPALAAWLDRRQVVKHFSVEVALIKGTHRTENRHPSVLHFSVNKCATQYVQKILTACALENGMTPVGLNRYGFSSDFPYLGELSLEEMQAYQHVFKPHGYCYTAFNRMIEGIPGFEKYKTVLMLRDPRDLLVSFYYSIAVSHVEPNKHFNKYPGFIRKRMEARAMSIDEYVIKESVELDENLKRYKDLLIDRYSHIYRTSFEEMVDDFSKWLSGLLEACDLKISDEMFHKLVEENAALRPKKENVRTHIRKGRAGDFKEKLKPETIERLNERFTWFLQ